MTVGGLLGRRPMLADHAWGAARIGMSRSATESDFRPSPWMSIIRAYAVGRDMARAGECVILVGHKQGSRLLLPQGDTLIGDVAGCHLQFNDLGLNGGHHGIVASITFDGHRYALVVMNRSVPVWLNDQPASPQTTLQDRDVIGFDGQSRAIEFRLGEGSEHVVQRCADRADGEGDGVRSSGSGEETKTASAASFYNRHRRWLVISAFAIGILALVLLQTRIHRTLSALTQQVNQQQEVLNGIQARLEQIQRDVEAARATFQGETGLIGRIATTYSPSICLIESGYRFVERGTGKWLREAATADGGIPIFQGDSKFYVTTDEIGPIIEETVIGTGFIISPGLILTNLHVARPWWKDEASNQIVRQGFIPRATVLKAYFPSAGEPVRLDILGASETYDLAICRFDQGELSVPIPPLADAQAVVEVGQSVVLLGYPAGVEGLLTRLDESVARSITQSTSLRVTEVTQELARRGLIRPLPTQGRITALTPTRIIHDAATTSGGSGGPLFNKDGVVVGIIYAVTEFSASNLAVPAHVIRDFLKQHGVVL